MLFAGPLAGAIGRTHRIEVAARRRDADREHRGVALRHDPQVIRCRCSSPARFSALGVGAAFAAMAALIADNVDALEMGVASGMNTVVRMVGSVIGGQVAAARARRHRRSGRTSIPAESAYTVMFALSAVAALAAGSRHRALDRHTAAAPAARSRPKPGTSAPPVDDARSSSLRTHDQPFADADFHPRADVQGTSWTAPLLNTTPEVTRMSEILRTFQHSLDLTPLRDRIEGRRRWPGRLRLGRGSAGLEPERRPAARRRRATREPRGRRRGRGLRARPTTFASLPRAPATAPPQWTGRLDDTILLKTERMRGSRRPGRLVARVEAGAMWGQLLEAAAEHGLVRSPAPPRTPASWGTRSVAG